MKVVLFFILFLNVAWAANEPHVFRPDYWSRGLHLAAGGGINAVHFTSDDQFDEIGYGINFKTDLGYYFTHNFAIEWSSNVKFNQVDGYQVWDTLITGGIRYRFNEYYVRGFYGKSPTVIFFNGRVPDEYKGTKASRLQFDGPVYGLAFGKFFKKDNGLIWFLEYSASFQKLEEREAIHMDGQVPEVVGRSKDSSTITTLYLMIGILIF